jgi:hypothetical protein
MQRQLWLTLVRTAAVRRGGNAPLPFQPELTAFMKTLTAIRYERFWAIYLVHTKRRGLTTDIPDEEEA